MIVMTCRPALIRPFRSRDCTVFVTAGRCTPSMTARNLCVRVHFSPIDAIVRHEQPPSQACFHVAAAVGQRRLRGLDEEGVGAPYKTTGADARFGPWLCAGWRADALPGSGRLNICLVGGAVMAQHDCQAGHAFPPDDANLDASLARSIGDHRSEATLDEVDSVDAAVGCLQLIRQEGRRGKMWFQQGKIGTR